MIISTPLSPHCPHWKQGRGMDSEGNPRVLFLCELNLLRLPPTRCWGVGVLSPGFGIIIGGGSIIPHVGPSEGLGDPLSPNRGIAASLIFASWQSPLGLQCQGVYFCHSSSPPFALQWCVVSFCWMAFRSGSSQGECARVHKGREWRELRTSVWVEGLVLRGALSSRAMFCYPLSICRGQTVWGCRPFPSFPPLFLLFSWVYILFLVFPFSAAPSLGVPRTTSFSPAPQPSKMYFGFLSFYLVS